MLTAPPNLHRSQVADAQRLRLATQPWLGLGGLLLTAVVFFVLALGTSSAATGLLILGPISTFGLAGVAVIAFWWNDWPGSRLAAPWTGVIDTLLVAAIAVVLTIAGQAVIERPDIGAVFEATPGPAAPTTFPATMALAGATFTAMLQLSLVALYRALAAYADSVRWVRAAPEDWIASASLSFAGAGIILHVGIGLRWPFAGLRRDAVVQRLPDDFHPALRAELAEDAGDVGLDGTS